MPPIYWVNRKSGYYLSSQHETFSFKTKYGKFQQVRLLVSKVKTLGFDYGKLSFQLVGTNKGIYIKQPKQIPFEGKGICFGIKVLYFGEDLKNTILFYSFDYCYGSCFI